MIAAILVGCLALSLANFNVNEKTKLEGFLAEPKSGKGSGVLVLHPWWGLNEDTKAFCRRLAEAGFTAFAPDLFEGKTATTEAEAEALIKDENKKPEQNKAKIAEAAKYLEERTGKKEIAVVGFSFGGYYALEFSNDAPDRVKKAVIFYGTGAEDFSESQASYLGHFAENDDFEPKESVDALAKLLSEAKRPATIHTYSGMGHWFFEPSVKKAYNKAASDLAWQRTLDFLKQP